MKKLFAPIFLVLMTTQTFAAKMECAIEERNTKTFQMLDYSPAVVIEDGKETKLGLKTGATLSVVSHKICAADGGPCSKDSVLNITLRAGSSLASIRSGEMTPYLNLQVGNRSIRASCLPVIGE